MNGPIKSVREARVLTESWILKNLADVKKYVSIGLPEIDDRYKAWRVPITVTNDQDHLIGEIRINFNGSVVKYTDPKLIKVRAQRLADKTSAQLPKKSGELFYPAAVPNKVILGDAADVLEEFPPDTAQLAITSPPYYNAKPESCEFIDYQEYLDFLRKAIVRVHRVLSEGRFFVINVSPVLIRRTSRKTSSKRIPIPFDVHQIMDSADFEFIDDIIWVKPEGAGWNLGRGRRFAADRQPLQYKPVTVTEYVLVYRKKTDKLIDWNIRRHHSKDIVKQSRIDGKYDITNVWRVPPGHHKHHPAVFPDKLIQKVIHYYSFIDDMVLDPFAGSGTVGRVAISMKRRFLLIDNNPEYFNVMKRGINSIKGNLRVDYEVMDESREEWRW